MVKAGTAVAIRLGRSVRMAASVFGAITIRLHLDANACYRPSCPAADVRHHPAEVPVLLFLRCCSFASTAAPLLLRSNDGLSSFAGVSPSSTNGTLSPSAWLGSAARPAPRAPRPVPRCWCGVPSGHLPIALAADRPGRCGSGMRWVPT